MFGSVLRITPPMCINEADVEFAINVFKDALIKLRERRVL